jgi:serine protease AprX
MAAPMVAGAAALLLQDEPDLTPAQVKYRLTHTASSVGGEPYLDVYAAVTGTTTESANLGIRPHDILCKAALIAYWASENGADSIDWDSVNWDSVNWGSVNWDSVNWDSVNWDSVNWDSVNWDSVNWDSVNWDSVNWDSVNWDSVNWDSGYGDSVEWNGVFWGKGKGKN